MSPDQAAQGFPKMYDLTLYLFVSHYTNILETSISDIKMRDYTTYVVKNQGVDQTALIITLTCTFIVHIPHFNYSFLMIWIISQNADRNCFLYASCKVSHHGPLSYHQLKLRGS